MKTLPTNATKQEEIEHLMALARTCPDGTYLASFFNPALLEWATEMIRADVGPDVWAYFTNAQEQARVANATFIEYRKALEAAEQKAAELNQQWRMQVQENDLQNQKQLDLLGGQLNFAMAEADKTKHRVYDLEGRLFNLGVELHEERGRVADLEAEVIRLKAEIYDLEHSKEGGAA